mmetsp:Transcript_739/g.2249  ORF Transcript_739/g.2249 Transcript_739/m.2249 type:complete len:319 (+) Transcript_739:240-1196(+)
MQSAQGVTVRQSLPKRVSPCNGQWLPSVLARQHKALRQAGRRRAALVSRAASQTDVLTKEDLVAYVAGGCKPKSDWRIGTEHEKVVFNTDDNTRADYSQIKKLLEFIVDRFGWQPMMEGDSIIGCKMGGQSVTLEPGGQFELSGAPLDSIHKTCAEVNGHLYQAKAIAEEMGVGFLGVGFDPKWSVEDVPVMPKGRYKLMKAYMPTVGTMGLDMMFRSCTVQVNLDYSSERDMVEKFRIGLALQPVATALFANSPFTDGKPNGFKSFRSHVWTDVDNARTGRLPFVFDDDFGCALSPHTPSHVFPLKGQVRMQSPLPC